MTDGEAPGYTPLGLPARLQDAARQRGVRPVAGDFARFAGRMLTGLPHVAAGSHGEFRFGDRAYPYLYGAYKRSWLTERAVEVPIAQAVVDAARGQRILEVGNVLSHYRPQEHTVVDKYEQRPGVINRDVLDLAELGEYDLVLAISTLEHVGWDEEPRTPGLAVDALRSLRERVAPGGRLLITHPIGYNPPLDAALREGAVPFATASAMRRVGGGTLWREVSADAVWSAPYDFLLYSARGVLVAELDPPS